MSEPAATYHEALDRPLDRLRYLLGDFDVAAPLLPDVTYAAVLAQQFGDERLAVIQLAGGLVTKYAQVATSTSIGGISVSFATRITGWRDLITRLTAEIAAATGAAQQSFDVLRPQRPGDTDRAEYRRERGDVECW